MPTSVPRKMLFPNVLVLAIIGFIMAYAPATQAEDKITFIENKDYINKFPNEKPKKPVLVEFFSYMCRHCYTMETTLARWKKQKPADVELVKIPVTFGRPDYKLVARGFYIAEELKIQDQFDKLIFKRIHVEKKAPRREKDLLQLFIDLGVSKEDFNKAAKSFSVDSKLRKADFLSKKFRVTGTPYFLINYKYEVAKERFRSDASLFELWNHLPGKDF